MSKYDHASFPGKPWAQGDAREKALAEGLRELAKAHGVTFQERLLINSMGEIDLFLEQPPHGQPHVGYGVALAELIAKHRPRTGVFPTKFIHEHDSWCMMNHFDVQQMLEEWETSISFDKITVGPLITT